MMDKYTKKFENMSKKQRIELIKRLSRKIEEINKKILYLTEKQNSLYENYFVQNKSNFYKNVLEKISKQCDDKILKLQKDKNNKEIDMLYLVLADKKARGINIEITK